MSAPYTTSPQLPRPTDASSDSSDDEFGYSPQTEKQQRKKAGRKQITTKPADKRVAQNRQAQRAFRERKEAYLQGLEAKVKEQETRIAELEQENAMLRQVSFQTTLKVHSPSAIGDLNVDFFAIPQHHQSPASSSDQSTPAPTPDCLTNPASFASMLQQASLANQQYSSTHSASLSSSVSQPQSANSDGDLFSFLNYSPATMPLQPPADSPTLEDFLGIKPEPDTTIPEFKATIEYLETQPASVMDPNVVRLPHLNVFQAALKQLPSLKNNVSTALVDELCQRFVAFTTKSCCAGLALPAADSFPYVNEEHRQLLACRERILGACSPTDVQKASEIMRFASSRHKAHYDRVAGKWDNALFRFGFNKNG
ncbi:hypothetical protein HDU98_001788 [Podochytrium sp. JEL0797]|nr:hypothetical protein HDU98_001788 [Podochytrium sp. JEL0797]